MRVLIAENIGSPGYDLLRHAGFHVDTGFDWSREMLLERIDQYHGILIRSATKLDREAISRATNLQAIARAGVGVDNVDVAAATERGIIVANAPASNVVTAAEHTMALLLSLARNIPQAHGSLKAGEWNRSQYTGVELSDKTLGVLGFGRIGQLVAERAKAFGMHIIAYDPYVSTDRYIDLGVTKADTPQDLYTAADFITIHLPKTPETEGWVDAAAFASMKDGVCLLNVARGPLLVEEALQDALDSGKVAGAALDVFTTEPMTHSPLFMYDNVIVTPHLGASTTEATNRAGLQSAEQLRAALTGEAVTTAVNLPTIDRETMAAIEPFWSLCSSLGALAVGLQTGTSIDSITVEFLGSIAAHDTRPLVLAALVGALSGHTDQPVNAVNAPMLAQERGIEVTETKNITARDFTSIIRITVRSGETANRVAGILVGNQHWPHLIEAWGQRFNLQLEQYLSVFRYNDLPGMLGKIGTVFGNAGINISESAVGRTDDTAHAVTIVTTDSPVPATVIEQIIVTPGFEDGRTLTVFTD